MARGGAAGRRTATAARPILVGATLGMLLLGVTACNSDDADWSATAARTGGVPAAVSTDQGVMPASDADGASDGDGPANDGGVGLTEAPSLVGMWTASDGSGTKVIYDDGSCTGMYYNAGRPLDIGGPMRCMLSSGSSSDGTFLLDVRQPPNESTFHVSFPDENTMVMSVGGDASVTMTRQ